MQDISYFSVLPLLFDFFSGSAHECYYLPDCQGESFPVENARECCVGTEDGVSYSQDGDCTIRQCIGNKIIFAPVFNTITPLPSVHMEMIYTVHGFPHVSFNVTESN